MTQRYQITAYSPSLHQEIEWFNLENLAGITNDLQAQQSADAHAARFNQLKHMTAEDWVGRWRLIEVGIQTIPGYIQR